MYPTPGTAGCTIRVEVALSSWVVDSLLRSRTLETLNILDLPAEAVAHGFRRLEVCHFHLPAQSSGRDAFAECARSQGAILQTLLIDDGDLTHPDRGEEDEAWIASWVAEAERLGFARARVIAGRQPWSLETRTRSAAALRRLADRAGVRVMIENWPPLLNVPSELRELLDQLGGEVGLCADFGNWSDEADLASIFPLAETIHAKNSSDDDGIRFRRLATAARSAGFVGPWVLVASVAGHEWESLQHDAAFFS
ncbi:MAG: sugar phosphate isomerase [Armatimonadota bacterium]